MNIFAKSAIGLAVAFLLAAPAVATVQSSGRAELSNVTFSVMDLTPEDGITAGLVFGSRDSRFSAEYSVGAMGPSYWGYMTGSVTAQPTFYPLQVQRSLQYDGAKVEVHSSGELGSMGSTFTSTLEASSGHPWEQRLQTVAVQNQRILLRANSALTVAGIAEGSVTRTAFPEQETDFLLTSNFAASLNFVSADGPGQRFDQTIYAYGDNDEFAREFSLSAVNNNDFDIELALTFYMTTGFKGDYHVAVPIPVPVPTSPVPEPSTWLMLSVGALAISGRAWQKSRSSRA